MSEAKKKYLENPTHYNLLNYTAELEKEKAELIEVLKLIATVDDENDEELAALAYRVKDILIKHGVEL